MQHEATYTAHQHAVVRCRRAYESNGIAWDKTLEAMTAGSLNDLAAYWEARHAGAEYRSQHEEERPILMLTIGGMARRLRRIAGIGYGARHGALAQTWSQVLYHGS